MSYSILITIIYDWYYNYNYNWSELLNFKKTNPKQFSWEEVRPQVTIHPFSIYNPLHSFIILFHFCVFFKNIESCIPRKRWGLSTHYSQNTLFHSDLLFGKSEDRIIYRRKIFTTLLKSNLLILLWYRLYKSCVSAYALTHTRKNSFIDSKH